MALAGEDYILALGPIDIVVGARVTALRSAQGKTIAQLASAIGRTEVEVARYEAGEQRIPPDDLIKIRQFLGVNLADLFPSPDRNHDPKLH